MSPADESCIFCDIVAGRAPGSFVARNELNSVFMDINPVNPGHMLVVSNAHYAALAELPAPVAASMFVTAQTCARALRASEFRSEGVNLLYADGAAAFQEVFHAHLHVFPRFRGDSFRIRAAWDLAPSREELDRAAAHVAGLLDPDG